MAQSMTVKAEKNPFMDANVPIRLVLDWVSAVGGTVSLPIASTYSTAEALKGPTMPQPSKIQGIFMSCQTIPGLNGDMATAKPTAYTLAILDAYGDDILNNVAVATPRSASVAQTLLQGTPREVDSELTVTITTAGDGTKGRIILELKDMGYGKL